MNDPEIEFKELIENNWVASNTILTTDTGGYYEPYFVAGWLEPGRVEPTITVTGTDEFEATGSASGYSNIKGDGTGPDSEMNGLILANCWCNKNQTDKEPEDVVFSLHKEIIRIIIANYEATQYRNVGVRSARKITQEEENPKRYRYEVEIGYQYTRSELIT